MKRSDQDALLRDVFDEESLESLRARSLGQMLEVAQGRRRRRRLLSATAASLAIAVTFMAVTRERALPPVPAAMHGTPSTIETINDQQLLALVADRSVALIGQAGAQELMFLDVADEKRISRRR